MGFYYPAIDGNSSSGGGSAIDELNNIGDVEITTPSNGQSIVYDDGDWINSDVAGDDPDWISIIRDTSGQTVLDGGKVIFNTISTQKASGSDISYSTITGEAVLQSGVYLFNSSLYPRTTGTWEFRFRGATTAAPGTEFDISPVGLAYRDSVSSVNGTSVVYSITEETTVWVEISILSGTCQIHEAGYSHANIIKV